MMENKLDGNAAAGILQAIFPFDMTLVEATCTGCGATNMIGGTAAYMHGMGTMVRCPSCNNVLIRIVHARGRYLLDMRGVRPSNYRWVRPDLLRKASYLLNASPSNVSFVLPLLASARFLECP